MAQETGPKAIISQKGAKYLTIFHKIGSDIKYVVGFFTKDVMTESLMGVMANFF